MKKAGWTFFLICIAVAFLFGVICGFKKLWVFKEPHTTSETIVASNSAAVVVGNAFSNSPANVAVGNTYNGAVNSVVGSPGAVVGNTVVLTNAGLPVEITFSDIIRNIHEEGFYMTQVKTHIKSQYAVPRLVFYADGDHLDFTERVIGPPKGFSKPTIWVTPINVGIAEIGCETGSGEINFPNGQRKQFAYVRIMNAYGDYKLDVRSTNIDNVVIHAKVE
jgi:hypothetical protein